MTVYYLFWWIVLPLRQTNALYECGFFEGILKKAKFVVLLIFPDSLFHGNYWDLKFSWIPTKTTHGSTYDSPLPVFAEKKLCIIVLLFCNIIALKLCTCKRPFRRSCSPRHFNDFPSKRQTWLCSEKLACSSVKLTHSQQNWRIYEMPNCNQVILFSSFYNPLKY